MKLYIKAGACSLAPHIMLCETESDFTVEGVDLATKITETGANFYDINPRGQVPTLVLDDGSVLTEITAIMEYICDRESSQNLLAPVGDFKRYQAISWISYVGAELHKSFGPLFNPNVPEDYKESVRKGLHAKFSYLNGLLSKQHYFLGDEFSPADAYLYVVLNWTKRVDLDLSDYPALLKFINLIGSRSAVKRARVEEGLPETI